MAIKEVLVRHTHFPDVSILAGERSEAGELRVVTHRMKVAMGERVVAYVATGEFSYHLLLAKKIAESGGSKANKSRTGKQATEFRLPKSLPYRSAVLIGLRSAEGLSSVFTVTHGSREKASFSDDDTHDILRMVAAGAVRALEIGHEIDHGEPTDEPNEPGQFPESVRQSFEVTPQVLERFSDGVAAGQIGLTEEISHSAASGEAVVRMPRVDLSKIKDYTVNSDPFADDEG